MPFTPSHIAAVLPLAAGPLGRRVGRWLPPSALVIGSMAPDLPYFADTPYSAQQSHTVIGALTAGVAAGLVCWLLWHGAVASAVLAVAPRALVDRLPSSALPGLRGRLTPAAAFGVPIGLAIGALTHSWWDAFTHEGRWAVAAIDGLTVQLGPLPAYQWAQYASGVLGLGVLLGWSWRWSRRAARVPNGVRRAGAAQLPGVDHRLIATAVWGAVAAAACLGGALAALEADGAAAAPTLSSGETGLHHLVYRAIAGAITGAGLAVLAWSLVWSLAGASRSRPASGRGRDPA